MNLSNHYRHQYRSSYPKRACLKSLTEIYDALPRIETFSHEFPAAAQQFSSPAPVQKFRLRLNPNQRGALLRTFSSGTIMNLPESF
jgi:hypothetical protein